MKACLTCWVTCLMFAMVSGVVQAQTIKMEALSVEWNGGAHAETKITENGVQQDFSGQTKSNPGPGQSSGHNTSRGTFIIKTNTRESNHTNVDGDHKGTAKSQTTVKIDSGLQATWIGYVSQANAQTANIEGDAPPNTCVFTETASSGRIETDLAFEAGTTGTVDTVTQLIVGAHEPQFYDNGHTIRVEAGTGYLQAVKGTVSGTDKWLVTGSYIKSNGTTGTINSSYTGAFTFLTNPVLHYQDVAWFEGIHVECHVNKKTSTNNTTWDDSIDDTNSVCSPSQTGDIDGYSLLSLGALARVNVQAH